MFRRIKTCFRRFVRTDPVLRGPRSAWLDARKGVPQMCPHCVAITPQRFIWSPENAVRLLANLLLIVIAIVVFPITIIDLWRRRCAKCGYNLRGNTSGRCPECGWEIPPGVVPGLDAQRAQHAEA